MKIKVGTVCSGIGSPEVALRNLGVDHDIVFACEKDKYARQTYLANFTPLQMFEDMTKDDWTHEYVDLFIGGIPCQAFSLAGKRLGELDPRGLLFYDFYKFVKEKQPKYFIIENVKGLLSDKGGNTFDNWIKLLSKSVNKQEQMIIHEDSLLYNVHWKVLNSKNFGVPQNRERVFIVGIRNDLDNNFKFPTGWKLEKRLKDILEPVVDEKYYLSDKAFEYISKPERIKKAFTQIDAPIGLTLTAKGQTNWTGDFITEPTTLSGADVCNTIRTGGKGSMDLKHSWDVVIVPEATKQGFDVAKEGDSINISNPNSSTTSGRVGKGIANTLDTACNQAVVEPFCVAMRGRNPENPSNRTTGSPTEQRLEENGQGITNTLTSVQKDNLVVEPILAHQLPGYEQDGRVYDEKGVSPTVDTKSGRLKSTTNSRIRRLTPLECMRLQAFPDEYIKVCSETQQYKMAVNSITVNVIQEILKNLLNL